MVGRGRGTGRDEEVVSATVEISRRPSDRCWMGFS